MPAGLLEHGLPPKADVLADIADAVFPWQGDGSVIGLKVLREEVEESGLAAAVSADQTDSLPFVDGEPRTVEYGLRAEGVAQIVDTNHGGYKIITIKELL
jgi:hypothetical protein